MHGFFGIFRTPDIVGVRNTERSVSRCHTHARRASKVRCERRNRVNGNRMSIIGRIATDHSVADRKIIVVRRVGRGFFASGAELGFGVCCAGV